MSDRGQEWRETYRPFHFRASPEWAIEALREIGVDWTSLANNHLMDYGERALLDTTHALEDADIAYSGAGDSLAAAREPSLVTVGGLDVALFSLTDNTPEFAAGEKSPGTAYLPCDPDDEETRTATREILDRAETHDPDLVVASLHWGPNMVEQPDETRQRFARWLVEEGVDVVYGHSAHVFQGVEVYRGAPILYDTGDFVDDYAVDARLHNDRSFLFELALDPEDGTPVELRLLPTEIYEFSVHEATETAASWSRKRMRSLSEAFGTEFEREGEALVLAL